MIKFGQHIWHPALLAWSIGDGPPVGHRSPVDMPLLRPQRTVNHPYTWTGVQGMEQ